MSMYICIYICLSLGMKSHVVYRLYIVSIYTHGLFELLCWIHWGYYLFTSCKGAGALRYL